MTNKKLAAMVLSLTVVSVIYSEAPAKAGCGDCNSGCDYDYDCYYDCDDDYGDCYEECPYSYEVQQPRHRKAQQYKRSKHHRPQRELRREKRNTQCQTRSCR